jgi:MFS family permease
LPSAAGIVSDEFPESRQRYIGLFTSIFPIGMIIGPNLGGWMIEAFGWRSIFWFNVPLGIIVVILARLLFRPGGKSSFGGNLDFAGIGLLSGSLISLMLGLTELGNSNGISWAVVGVLFAAGIIFMLAFIRREQRAPEPVIDMELLRKKPFLAANIYNIIYGFTALGVFSLVPLYAVSVYKLGIFESGLILTSRSVCIIIASSITSVALVKWGYRKPILIGTILCAIGLALLSFRFNEFALAGLHIGSIPLLLIILGLCGIGHGICTPAASNACIELMPEKVATITGLRGMFRQLGAVFGVAISTVIINTISSAQQAFFIIMLGSAVIMLVSIPSIFSMPSSPKANPA